MADKQTTPRSHEGATESPTPGRPDAREVITPDWAVIDKGQADCVSGDTTDRTDRAPARPTIDRHR